MRAAFGSPSLGKGTPASVGFDPFTNVISGCTEATDAPHRRRDDSSSLVNAPLECRAIFPFQSPLFASNRATSRIAASGTHNQTTSADIVASPTSVVRDAI